MRDTFSDLPDALVRDLLAQATPVAESVSTHLNRLRQARGAIRKRVQSEGLIARKADLDVTREPSVQLESAVQDCKQRPSLAAKREIQIRLRARCRPEKLSRSALDGRQGTSSSSTL